MKILITGGTGRIGARFVPYLLQKGHQIRLLVRDKTKANTFENVGAETVQGDVTTIASLPPAVKDIEVIIHLAAYFRTRNDDAGIKAVNTAGTIALAEAALAAGVGRFVFVSTGLVYGATNQWPAREEDPRAGLQMAYPASKIAAEDALLKMYREKGFDVRIARLGFVYGAGDPHLSEALPLMKTWNWHPAQRLHLVHHLDVAQALCLLAQTDGLASQAYNVADDAPLTAYEIATMEGNAEIFKNSTVDLKNPWEGLLDTRKLRNTTNFRPIVPSYYVARDLSIL